MDVLITGASGQIGSYVFEHLIEKFNIIGVDIKPFENEFDERLVICDLREGRRVNDLLREFKPNVVIHLAAQVSVDRSWKDPVYDAENNIISTINLLLSSTKFGVEKFVYFSSAAVYGDPKYIPIDEEHPLEPISPYGISKLVGEFYCRLYSSKMNIIVLRPFNVFSERMNLNDPYSGVIAKFVWRVKRGLPPIIYGDGRQTRDFVHVKDVISFLDIVLSLENDDAKFHVYNVGTGKETSILELAKIVISISGIDVEPIFERPRKGDIRRSCADVSKARRLGFEPKTDLREDIKRLFDST